MAERGAARARRAAFTLARIAAVAAALLGQRRALAELPPKLVVVVVVDQLPRSYLDRFAPLFVEGGFRRLLEHGADYASCHHGHAATWTAPGHAAVLTGAYPLRSGIIGNQWFSRAAGRIVGCVEDAAAPLVGGPDPEDVGVSPAALRARTVGDVLRGTTGGRAKVIAVAGKDRSAVLLGGAHPDAAFWFDEESCAFISSRHYLEKLPAWAGAFNGARQCAPYLGKNWDRLRDDVDYTMLSGADDIESEADNYGLGRVFPHPIREWLPAGEDGAPRSGERYAAVEASPFGNELVLRFAVEALRAEGLGKDDVPDLLAVGLSSNDLVGHLFGPASQEVLDVTLRTDLALRDFMQLLDREVGEGRWLLALTSDHGVAPIPELLRRQGLLDRDTAYRFGPDTKRVALEQRLRDRLFAGRAVPPEFPGFLAAWGSQTHPFVYLDERSLAALPGTTRSELLAVVAREIAALPGVARVYTSDERSRLAASRDELDTRVYRAWNERTGGDLVVVLEPNWLATPFPAGSTHGSPYPYDTHVPLLLYGSGVRAVRVHREVAVVDIAPTLAARLGVEPPPLNQGEVLREALQRGN